jgi:hypothetical protein
MVLQTTLGIANQLIGRKKSCHSTPEISPKRALVEKQPSIRPISLGRNSIRG